MSVKYPLIPAGIEQATFGYVAQHLNQCATAVLEQEGDGTFCFKAKVPDAVLVVFVAKVLF